MKVEIIDAKPNIAIHITQKEVSEYIVAESGIIILKNVLGNNKPNIGSRVPCIELIISPIHTSDKGLL